MKKTLIRGFLLLTSAFVLAACNEIEGQITATQSIQMNVTEKSNWCSEGMSCEELVTKKLLSGQYETRLSMVSKRDAQLKVKVGREEWVVNFRVGKNSGLNSENGPIVVDSKESGQPFGLRGDVKTIKTNSETKRVHESCSYTDYRHECYTTGNPPTTVCRDVPYTRWGYRDVEFYEERSDREIHLSILEPSSNVQLGEYGSQDAWIRKVYLYEGRCW